MDDCTTDEAALSIGSPPEPPAGLVGFASIKPSDLLNGVNEAGYEILLSPPQLHPGKSHGPKRPLRLTKHRSASYAKKLYITSFDEKRLRSAANLLDGSAVEKLIASCPDIDINAPDEKSRTPLHFASSRGADDVVHVLLKNGADPNVTDANGNSPLHLAACTHHIRVITLLLHYGGDANAVDFAGKTPLHLALSRLRILKSKELHRGQPFSSIYLTNKRKAEVGEIVSMLQEYFDKKGQQSEHIKMCELKEKLAGVSMDSEVDEIGSMLADFTQMTIDAGARSRMAEE